MCYHQGWIQCKQQRGTYSDRCINTLRTKVVPMHGNKTCATGLYGLSWNELGVYQDDGMSPAKFSWYCGLCLGTTRQDACRYSLERHHPLIVRVLCVLCCGNTSTFACSSSCSSFLVYYSIIIALTERFGSGGIKHILSHVLASHVLHTL